MAPTPPQLPSEASVVSSVDMDMDTEAAQQPPTSSAETKRVQIVTPSGGPPQTGQLGPERPPSFLAMGSFTCVWWYGCGCACVCTYRGGLRMEMFVVIYPLVESLSELSPFCARTCEHTG